ncbi:MAG: tRNA (adenosine(37)-N6)-threonylcarbamoyltransferase complex ATPase subunit type 1 TsaE [Patescibacteria group bacterium]
MKKVFKNEKETLAFAERFAQKLRGGEVVALIGELGAGKTVFAKGMASGLGIKERVQSPTFLLMKIYNVRPSTGLGHKIKHLCHVDAYRLSDAVELVDIGILDWLGRADTVAVIEWADKVAALIRGRKVIKIKMKLGGGEEKRKVEVISN